MFVKLRLGGGGDLQEVTAAAPQLLQPSPQSCCKVRADSFKLQEIGRNHGELEGEREGVKRKGMCS